MTILGKLRHPWVQTRPVACTPSTHCTPCKVDSAHHAKCTEHTMHSAHYAQSAQKKFAQHCVNMHPSLRYIEVFKISQSAGFGNGLFTRIYEQLVHTFNFYLFSKCLTLVWWQTLRWKFKGVSRSSCPNKRPLCQSLWQYLHVSWHAYNRECDVKMIIMWKVSLAQFNTW